MSRRGLLFGIINMCIAGFFPVATHYFVATIDPLLFGGFVLFIGSLPFIIRLAYKGVRPSDYTLLMRAKLVALSLFATVGSIFFF